MKLNAKTTVPFIFALTSCTLPNLTALRIALEGSPPPTIEPTQTPADTPIPQESTSATATPNVEPSPAPSATNTPTPTLTHAPTSAPTPTALPQGTFTVSFDYAASPTGTIGYGQVKRFANYQLTTSAEEAFAIQQSMFSWQNFTSQNTSLSNFVLSLDSTTVASYPFLDANPFTQMFNSSAVLSENRSGILHVDATLTDVPENHGVNPGDVVAVALHSLTATGVKSGVDGAKNFEPPLLGNKLVVVPFAIQSSSAFPGGIQQTPSTNAAIGLWTITSLLMSQFGSVDLKGIRIAINGNGGGPLQNLVLSRYSSQDNLATISSVTVPTASLDIPFSKAVTFTRGVTEQLSFNAYTILYKQMGGYAALQFSIIGYTIADRNDPSKSIYIDLSNEPILGPTMLF